MTAETLAASPGPSARYSSGHLQTIRKAILMGRTVRMVYGRNGKVEERAVDPYGILFGRSYFLVGPVVGKSSPVQWRLDRIESIEID
ncbi:WYL domain-containing protein, partial [Salmonella enterica]|uniref:WYL domain-containing protein n=1 Tax=Salmonella enterica TaxID=28901 RepID=UPI0019D6A0E6